MTPLPDTLGVIEMPGPWQHRYVAANGARFHVADASPGHSSDAPLVLLLHGFPEFWWSWRHQLPALTAAGYRAAAMDLRGYGGSDKTPNGYDPFTLARDVAGVIKALGERDAVVVGHGWGGYVGWAATVLHPREVSALCAVAAPHPGEMLRRLRTGHRVGALRHVLAMQAPLLPERRIANPASGYLRRHLQAWSAPGSLFPDEQTVATYQAALSLWPAPHCALEYHRWLVRSRVRFDGREFNRAMRRPVEQAVCGIQGSADPALPPLTARALGPVRGRVDATVLPGLGHFPHEEDPERFNEALLGWLGSLSRD